MSRLSGITKAAGNTQECAAWIWPQFGQWRLVAAAASPGIATIQAKPTAPSIAAEPDISLASGFRIVISVPDDRPCTILCTFSAGSSMSSGESRRLLAKELAAAITAYQDAIVIQHCAKCAKPCCRLDPLVLELDWKQLKALWQIEESRKAFDRRLCSGKGPEDIRAGDGFYYAHGKVCPAYDEAGWSCKVYGQELKPSGCSDFPVYEDRGGVVADLRCEAVALDELVAWMARAAGTGFRITTSANEEFPFLVTLSVRRAGGTETVSKRQRDRK
jgi:Fe-S-cluster containining protein